MQKKTGLSVLGGACIVASVCVGAGMLALPSVGAGAWTLWSAFALTLTMVVMTLSGFLLLESYQTYELRASFHTLTRDVLGGFANLISNLSVYFVGGILLYAYITTLGGLVSSWTGLSTALSSILVCAVFGGVIWHSTLAVERVSVGLIAVMVLTFFLAIMGLLGKIEGRILLNTVAHQAHDAKYLPYLWVVFPAALTSFGYHHSVTSLRAHYAEEKRAARAIFYGMLLALLIYLLWLLAVFGNLAREAFAPVIESGGEVGALLSALGARVASAPVRQFLDAFASAAILSSFVGVGLGVFDYLADLLKQNNSAKGRAITLSATFLPPLVLSLIAPFGFVTAIGYAGAVATLWTCIFPALLVWRLRAIRAKTGQRLSFITRGGNLTPILVFGFGVSTAIFHLLNMMGYLPVFKG